MKFTYSSWGAWQHDTAAADGGTNIKIDYFTYGTLTAVNDMPRTGTASYQLEGSGNYAEDAHLYVINASGTATADFAKADLNFNINLSGDDLITGGSGGLTNIAGDAPITGNTFSGAATFGQSVWTGTFAGQFYGPKATELGIVFSAANGQATLNGAVVGVKQ